MYLPKIREIREALGSLFSAPYTTTFPIAPYTPSDEFRGFPEYSPQDCVGCGACAQVCPTSAIELIDDPMERIRTLRINYGSCIHCGQCQEHCITGRGIAPTRKYALSVTDKAAPELFESVQKELMVCEHCGKPIATRDHLTWIKDRLGAKAYANPNLLLVFQEESARLPTAVHRDRLRREDYMLELCPGCRRTVVVADEF